MWFSISRSTHQKGRPQVDNHEPSKEKRSFTEHLERVWGQALLTVSAAEGEAHKVVQRIAEMAGSGQEEIRKQTRELAERISTQGRDVERQVEERVRKALTNLRVPRRDDVQAVRARIEKLSERIQNLASRQ
jgi:polyhydroxyalkanoate synthesis regulator phasin